MLTLTALAFGFLNVVTLAKPIGTIIAPSVQSTNSQDYQTQPGTNGKLYAEKLLPIKKSVKLGPTVTKGTSETVPLDRKVELSPENKEPQPVKSLSQREFEDRNWLRPNERPISIWDNSANGKGFNGFGNFHNFNR
jgi:hypothetical protein